MSEAKAHSRYDKNLEGLRGFCALAVVFGHLIGWGFFQSSRISPNNPLNYINLGHEAVLIFFILSGYVIGINHIGTPFNIPNVILYLKKRFIRLYPIYLIALCMVFALTLGKGFSLRQFVGHLFFMQEFFVPTFASDSALWSLSYEVVYYILFLVLWGAGKRNIWLSLVFVMLILGLSLVDKELTILKSLLIGWLFWLLGLFIAQAKKPTVSIRKPKWQPFISYFAIALSINYLDTSKLLLQQIHIPLNYIMQIGVGDLLFIPICYIIMIEVAGQTSKYINMVKILAFAIPAFHIFLLLYYKHPILSNIGWMYGTGYFVLALLTMPISLNFNIFGRLNNLGRVSYAIYVFHFPVFFFFNNQLSKYFSGATLLTLGLSSSLIALGLLSAVAELIIQPRIRKFLIGKS
jgi:peptidoglycan/LPS O-acetylase OafA/YrhL